MDTQPVETFDHHGYTIAIHHDDDCPSPRDDAWMLGTLVGLPHRRYRIGDEQIDPTTYTFACPVCGGHGVETAAHPDRQVGWCPACEGQGGGSVSSIAEFAHRLQAERGARVLLPVGLYDHSGVSYYIGNGPHRFDPGGWDSGLAGFIFDTPHALTECWGATVPTDGQITDALTAEIATYSQWADGECYGYTVTAPDGNEIDACWGYYGSDSWWGGTGYLIEQAHAAIDAHRAAEHSHAIALYKRLIG